MMTKSKVLIAGGAAAAVLATGGVAVAATSTPSATPSQGTAGTAKPADHHHDRLSRVEHGQYVVKDKAGKQVTRDVVNGTVTAVSATSISVKDGTGTTTTFSVGSTTRVHLNGQAKGTTSTISAVKTGTEATVFGNGTGPYAADYVGTH